MGRRVSACVWVAVTETERAVTERVEAGEDVVDDEDEENDEDEGAVS